jgi:hypothetical protein
MKEARSVVCEAQDNPKRLPTDAEDGSAPLPVILGVGWKRTRKWFEKRLGPRPASRARLRAAREAR